MTNIIQYYNMYLFFLAFSFEVNYNLSIVYIEILRKTSLIMLHLIAI